MTHTGQITVSKANTCYTGGVAYMEAGDTVAVRDLEPNRSAHFHIFPSFKTKGNQEIPHLAVSLQGLCLKAFALTNIKANCKYIKCNGDLTWNLTGNLSSGRLILSLEWCNFQVWMLKVNETRIETNLIGMKNAIRSHFN